MMSEHVSAEEGNLYMGDAWMDGRKKCREMFRKEYAIPVTTPDHEIDFRFRGDEQYQKIQKDLDKILLKDVPPRPLRRHSTEDILWFLHHFIAIRKKRLEDYCKEHGVMGTTHEEYKTIRTNLDDLQTVMSEYNKAGYYY